MRSVRHNTGCTAVIGSDQRYGRTIKCKESYEKSFMSYQAQREKKKQGIKFDPRPKQKPVFEKQQKEDHAFG